MSHNASDSKSNGNKRKFVEAKYMPESKALWYSFFWPDRLETFTKVVPLTDEEVAAYGQEPLRSEFIV